MKNETLHSFMLVWSC